MKLVARRTFLQAVCGLVGWVALGGMAPQAEAQLYGIDVSSYQGTVNWTSVKNAGYAFGFAKATEGTSTTDSQFATNWANMKATGIVPGAYHYGHPSESAVTQAQFFVNTVKAAQGGLSGGLQLVLDIETTDGESASTVETWIQNFVAEIQSLTGKPAIIYTSPSFWASSAGNSSNNENCPLWIANYASSPTIPVAWTTYTFWQYSDTGSVSGVSGNVDLDKFNGSMTTLQKFTFP